MTDGWLSKEASMRFSPDRCPECQDEPKGTLEVLEGVAEVFIHDDGSFEYGGYTQISWDSQVTVERDGKVTLVCHDWHRWQAVREP